MMIQYDFKGMVVRKEQQGKACWERKGVKKDFNKVCDRSLL